MLWILVVIIYLILLDELVMSSAQRRFGPFNIGIFGLLASIINGLNLLLIQSFFVMSSYSFIMFLGPLIFLFLLCVLFALLLPLFIIDIVYIYFLIILLSSVLIMVYFLLSYSSFSNYSIIGSFSIVVQFLSFGLVFDVCLSLGLYLATFMLFSLTSYSLFVSSFTPFGFGSFFSLSGVVLIVVWNCASICLTLFFCPEILLFLATFFIFSLTSYSFFISSEFSLDFSLSSSFSLSFILFLMLFLGSSLYPFLLSLFFSFPSLIYFLILCIYELLLPFFFSVCSALYSFLSPFVVGSSLPFVVCSFFLSLSFFFYGIFFIIFYSFIVVLGVPIIILFHGLFTSLILLLLLSQIFFVLCRHINVFCGLSFNLFSGFFSSASFIFIFVLFSLIPLPFSHSFLFSFPLGLFSSVLFPLYFFNLCSPLLASLLLVLLFFPFSLSLIYFILIFFNLLFTSLYYLFISGLSILISLSSFIPLSFFHSIPHHSFIFNSTSFYSFNFSILLFPVFIFVVFNLCVLVECNSVPFDIPEAESELVAGFMTEFSSLYFSIIILSEYFSLIIFSLFLVLLLNLNILVSLFLLFFWCLTSATLNSFNYDELLVFGWYFILLLSFSLYMLFIFIS